MNEIFEVKRLRKKLGLTQTELAKKSGVSQSLIAKVESGNLDPSYSNAKKIFETLTALDKQNELKAKQIMHKKIIYAKATETIKGTILRMREKNISQMPVIKHNKIVGYISEKVLLDKMLEGETQSMLGEVMESSPPIVPPDTPQTIIANLLRQFPFVLVKEKEDIIGIITKVDLLNKVYG